MAKILVTGGAGFIGSHLTDRLLKLGHKVTILDDLSTGKGENINRNAKFVLGDIRRNLSTLLKDKRFDYVYHLAAQTSVRKSFENPEEDYEINGFGSINVIGYCIKHGIKEFIFSSSAAVYSPEAEVPLRENSEVKPLSPYGKAKLYIEEHLERNQELDYACLRYGNVYGPRQDSKGEAGVVSIFTDNALHRNILKINGDGEQTRDFVYVKDVVSANVLALNLRLNGIFNVSTGKETSVNHLVRRIGELTDSDYRIKYVDGLNGELRRSCLSFEKINGQGWKPKYSLDRGLRETIAWFKKG